MGLFKGLLWGSIFGVLLVAVSFFAFLGFKTVCQFIGGVL